MIFFFPLEYVGPGYDPSVVVAVVWSGKRVCSSWGCGQWHLSPGCETRCCLSCEALDLSLQLSCEMEITVLHTSCESGKELSSWPGTDLSAPGRLSIVMVVFTVVVLVLYWQRFLDFEPSPALQTPAGLNPSRPSVACWEQGCS